jgi:hypothetical protein
VALVSHVAEAPSRTVLWKLLSCGRRRTTELGLLGLLLVAGSLLRFPCNSRTVMCACFAGLGVLLTPDVIGVPIFAVTLLMLLLSITDSERLISVLRR